MCRPDAGVDAVPAIQCWGHGHCLRRAAMIRSFLLVALSLPSATPTALAQGQLITWGGMVVDSRIQAETFVRVAAGAGHTIALRSDGTVAAWGMSPSGMPGCFGRVSPDVAVLARGAGGSAALPLPVPNVQALAGRIVYGQAIVFGPAAGNAAGLVMSDAVTLVIGP
jgi:hypothetical protein